jgi:ATP-binding cassette subfamily B protein
MVQENLAGIRVLHAFVQEEHEMKRFDDLNREHITKNMGLAKLFGMFTPSLVLTIGIAALITLWVGGKEVIAHQTAIQSGAVVDNVFSLGSFVAFNGYLLMLSWPMMAIGYVTNLTQKGLAAMDRIQEIFDSRSSLAGDVAPMSAELIEGGIEFKDLTFSYPGEPDPVLEHINLKIEAGSTVALIGMIGSGKSSLAQLIPRVFNAEGSSILIDGQPINEIPLEGLRSHIAFVDQEPFLFSTSIRNNIAVGRSDATDEEIDAMVRCVHLTPDLERWPQGLETMVGERGVSLSGGQKQRIALARALIRNPKILILDDAFSSLDIETEAIILSNIRRITGSLTMLIITHRLTITRQVDQILVMERGQIVERGNHEALIKNGGLYQRMYNNQALAREMEILLQ